MRTCLLVAVLLFGAGFTLAAVLDDNVATVLDQRVVIVAATSSADANLRAQAQNPGWTAVSARSIGNGLWEVTIRK